MIISDAINRCSDFNALIPWNTEDYMPYINQFLQDQSFSIEANEVNRTQIIAEVVNFASEDEILFRKMKKGIMASYIDFQFRGNLMQRMCTISMSICHMQILSMYWNHEHDDPAWRRIYVNSSQHVPIIKFINASIYHKKKNMRNWWSMHLFNHFNDGEYIW